MSRLGEKSEVGGAQRGCSRLQRRSHSPSLLTSLSKSEIGSRMMFAKYFFGPHDVSGEIDSSLTEDC